MAQPIATEGLRPGLADPVLDSQAVFRAILDAMAHPGRIVTLRTPLAPPPPLDPATALVALALVDYETPLWLDDAARTSDVAGYLRFHCGCPLTERPDESLFAIIAGPRAMPPFSAFQAGSDDYPDRSTTLVVQLPALAGGPAWTLRGPGIADRQGFAPAGLPGGFRGWLAENRALFPRGVDFVFTCGASLAAMPRSTCLEG